LIQFSSISKVIHAFSKLLQVEIAVFNTDGKLISATEEYIQQKGRKVHVPFFDTLFGSDITHLHQPGKMSTCEGCHFINNCPSKVEFVQDMIINGKQYGYLSFVSFSKESEKLLLEKKEYYTKWLSRLKKVIVSILLDISQYEENIPSSHTHTNYIFGNSNSCTDIYNLINRIKNSTSTVLITGETGTGKSLLAQSIHQTSNVRNGPFVELNCATIPENLFESELFGYEEGAFTNARKGGKEGYFEQADNGTLFLDEIADLPLSLQPKLLKVLQDGIIQRVGGTTSKKVSVRLIAATNQSFDELISNNLFRLDLFYRLNVVPITVPPLRDRLEDLPVFVTNIIEKLQERTGKHIKTYTNQYFKLLSSYDWPGNLRELENVIEYGMNIETGTILTEKSFPTYLLNQPIIENNVKQEIGLIEAEKNVIIEKLQQYGNTYNGKQLAARDLNISIRTLYRKIERHQIHA
jgi:transcriptional regulator with PAS, ATPase and Fis domain